MGATSASTVGRSAGMGAERDVVEVVLAWGQGGGGCVLATKYLRPGETFGVGETEGCDAVVPYEALGAARADVVSCAEGGGIVVPPRGAQAWIDGVPAPAEPIALAGGRVVDVTIGAFTIRSRMVEEELYATSFADNLRAADIGGFALSALAHLSVFAALALFLPALGADDDDGIARDQLLTMQHLLNASAEREQQAVVEAQSDAVAAPEDHGASGGGRARGKAGAMGTERAPRDPGHWSAKGDAERALQTLSRAEKQALVKDFGALGLLNAMNADPNAPTVPWGEVLNGADRDSHLGGLFGPTAADTWGIGGLALSGADEGGDGNNLGIGINDVGGLSASLDRRLGSNESGEPGCPPGQICAGHGSRVNGQHHVTMNLRMPREITTNGRLPAEVIQRIVRQNMGRFRACYESGLRTNPSLEGRVAVRFIIDRQGQVSVAQDGDSDLPNAAVRGCIVKSFYSLSFPSPDNGTVTVTYPIVLTPSS